MGCRWEQTTDREFLIRVSYMEIYNEEINDLLTLGNQKLPIHESLEVRLDTKDNSLEISVVILSDKTYHFEFSEDFLWRGSGRRS